MKTLPIRLAGLLLIALLAIGCSGNDEQDEPPTTATAVPEREATATAPDSLDLPPAEPIDWYDCDAAGFECAEYDVPLDYADPGADTIELTVRRMPATNDSERIGVLFANPGGPGGSAITTLSGWARTLPSELRERFDIVLFDPRGVGLSSPLVCLPDVQAFIATEPEPRTDADWQTLEAITQEFAQSCSNEGGELLPHIGTINVARDMDRLREAMGESEITYFGYSYGTTLGQTYAELFPGNVRAMVLDGGVDVTLDSDTRRLEQILGFEAAYARYVADCAARECLPGGPENAIEDLLRTAATETIPAPNADRPVGPGELHLAILGSLYSRASWALLTASLNAALDGDGSGLIAIADLFAGRRSDGTYSNQTEANAAVNCVDHPNSRNPADHRARSEEFAEQAPNFGAAAGASGLICALWAADPAPLPAPRATGAPPILVIGTTGDPATPYKWAVSLSQQLESGVLLTRDGEGHLAYRMGNRCIDDAVNAYLLDLVTPPEDTVCGEAGIQPEPPVP